MLDRRTEEPMLLANPAYARMARNALIRTQRDLGFCALRAWVVVHNHMHAALTPNVSPSRIAEEMMNHSEHAAGRALWERESYVRVLRTQTEIAEMVRLIEEHPVRADLVARAEDWEFSSAYRKRVALGARAACRPKTCST